MKRIERRVPKKGRGAGALLQRKLEQGEGSERKEKGVGIHGESTCRKLGGTTTSKTGA